MSDENPNVPTEPSSDLNVNLPEATIPEVVEPFPASPLDHPISPIPSENVSPVPTPPMIPNLPPPPPPPNVGNMPPPPPTSSYTPRQTYNNNPPQYAQNYSHAQYQQGKTSGKSSNKFLTGCCIGCAIVLVLAIISFIVFMKSCGGSMFNGIGSMIGDAITMKTMSKSDVESQADSSFTLDQLAQNPQDWQGKYVVFETTADIVDSSNPDSQTITLKSPMAIIMNLNPNYEVRSNMPIRVWGKVTKFDLSLITKYAPDMPKDATVTGFIVACTVEPSAGNSVPDNSDESNPDGVDNGGKPPADGENLSPDNSDNVPPEGSEGTGEEIPQK